MTKKTDETLMNASRFSQSFQKFSYLPPSPEQIRATQKLVEEISPLLKQMQRQFQLAKIFHFLYRGVSNASEIYTNIPHFSTRRIDLSHFFHFINISRLSKITDARETMNTLKPVLKYVQQELSKIDIQVDYTTNITPIISFIEFATTGILAEWHDKAYHPYYMRANITSSLAGVQKMRSNLKIVKKKLAKLVA